MNDPNDLHGSPGDSPPADTPPTSPAPATGSPDNVPPAGLTGGLPTSSAAPRSAEEFDSALAAGPGPRSQRDVLHDRVDHDFRYHEPKTGQTALYNAIRFEARALAHMIVDSVPASRERSTALTRLEECVMHANAGIARHG